MILLQVDFSENIVSPQSTDSEYTMVRTLRNTHLELTLEGDIVRATDRETGNTRIYPWSNAVGAIPAPDQQSKKSSKASV